MGIRHSHISLTCDLGSDELSVERSDYNEIMFVHKLGDVQNTIYVKDNDARQFAETILKVIGD